MSRFRTTALSLASGYAAMASNVVYTLASIPLALRYLPKDEFGLWALITQITGYLVLIDVASSLSRILIDHKDTRDDGMYGSVIRTLRGFTARTADKEPKWRVKGPELRTGYQKTW